MPAAGGVEVDHVQYGTLATLVATWDDGQAIRGDGGGLDPALLVALEPSGGSGPAVTKPDGETVVLSYSGLDPNEQLQINVASYGLPFYRPDPIKVVGTQIRVEFETGGTLATLTIDIASSSGGVLDPLNVVGFNPQPEPPSPDHYAFSPPPTNDNESLAIQAPLTGGSGPAGATQISLTLGILDDVLAPLPVSVVPTISTTPAMGPAAIALLVGAIAVFGLLGVRTGRRTRR